MLIFFIQSYVSVKNKKTVWHIVKAVLTFTWTYNTKQTTPTIPIIVKLKRKVLSNNLFMLRYAYIYIIQASVQYSKNFLFADCKKSRENFSALPFIFLSVAWLVTNQIKSRLVPSDHQSCSRVTVCCNSEQGYSINILH